MSQQLSNLANQASGLLDKVPAEHQEQAKQWLSTAQEHFGSLGDTGKQHVGKLQEYLNDSVNNGKFSEYYSKAEQYLKDNGHGDIAEKIRGFTGGSGDDAAKKAQEGLGKLQDQIQM